VKRWLCHPALARLAAVVVGLVFVYASHDKIWKRVGPDPKSGQTTALSGPAEFARVVYRYQIVGPSDRLSPAVPNTLAVTLPWIELVAGLLLLFGAWRREAALLCALLLLTFILAVGSALWRGIDLQNCGCFSLSGEGRRAGLGLIAADTGLLAAALLAARRRSQETRP
jgi:uncharacterized membrane protein YphA (DoxX/SURF4 family)